MLDYLDQAFSHPIIALRPLKSCVLMGDTVVLYMMSNFVDHFPTLFVRINSGTTYQQKMSSSRNLVVVFGIMVYSNQGVSIPHFSFKQRIHSVHGHLIKSRNPLSQNFGITNLHNKPTIITMFVHMVNI
jgi:hypothetical protein